MSGLFGGEPVDAVATWVAAAVTIIVLGGLLGERRLFGWTQHLFAGLLTGFLALLALSEVVVPRLLTPVLADPGGHPELWLGIALVASTAVAPWLPRVVAAVPLSVLVGSLAAFALGGAVIGTILPQLAATVLVPGETALASGVGAATAVITGLVLLGFLHGSPRGRLLAAGVGLGRWLLIIGLGGWLGYLIFSRLLLLIDRIAFLLGDWIGIGR